MARTWRKGPRCNVDNCPSYLWSTVNGVQQCQNGHVRQGVETVEDEGETLALGSRIRQQHDRARKEAAIVLASQHAESEEVFHGEEASRIVRQLVQDLLKAQVAWLVRTKRAPPELNTTVKSIWGLILEDSVTQYKTVTYVLAPSIVLLGCIRMRLPIFALNIARWISRYEMPYYDTSKWLDKSKLARIAPGMRPKDMTGNFLRIHRRTMELAVMLAGKYGVTFPEPPWQALVYQLVHDLMLPPYVYQATFRLQKFLRDKIPKVGESNDSPEIYYITLVFFAARLLYGFDEVPHSYPEDDVAVDRMHQGVWADIMRKVWLEEEQLDREDERLAILWQESKIDHFVDWYQEQHATKTLDIQLERLFPAPSAPSAEGSHVVADYPNSAIFDELNMMLWTEVPVEPETEPGTEHKPEPRAGDVPGLPYLHLTRYAGRIQPIPSTLKVLIQLLGRFAHVDRPELQLQRVERHVRQVHKKIYQELEHLGEIRAEWAPAFTKHAY